MKRDASVLRPAAFSTQRLSSARPPAWRPLRIAVIGGRGVPSNYSGVERICEDLFGIFASRGHRVTVYCRPQVLEEKSGSYKSMRLIRTPAPGGKNGETVSHSVASVMHACTFGDEGAPFDLISLHTLAPNIAAPIAKMAQIRVISHVHGLDHQREKWRGLGAKVIRLSERMMVASADQVIVVNPALQDYYRNTYGVETAILPNGIHPVDDAFAVDQATLDRFGLTRGGYIVSIGRIVPEKRIQDTIEAFARIGTELKLVFVGEGKHSLEYQDAVKSLGARDGRVVFTGQQSGAALETLFRCARLYVSASELEGMPASVLECMERRVPAVLSDIPPHRALFGSLSGYDLSFAPGDVPALRGRIERALADAEHCRALADAGRAFVRRDYVWPVLADRTERLYLAVAGGGGRAGAGATGRAA